MKVSKATRQRDWEMQKKFLLAIGGMMAIIAVLALTLTQGRPVHSGPQALTPTPNGLRPVDPALVPVRPTAIPPEIVDLAPDIPYEDKPAVVVQHPDGSRTMYLVAPDMLDTFINDLPEGDRFVGDISPPSISGGSEPPTPEP